jgi:peptidoglycan/xylan/chitin deacetylase (PgdA/CDA1 family)
VARADSPVGRRARRRLRRLLPAAVLLGTVPLVLLILLSHAPVKTAGPTTTTLVTTAIAKTGRKTVTTTPGTTLVAFPPVSSSAPLYDGGVRLPVALPAAAAALKLPILQFHAVGPRPIAGSWGARLTLPTSTFEAEMNYLTSHSYDPVTLEEVYAGMARLERLPADPIALTFDDGYLDDFTVAFPILRAHHFVATFFIITGAVGRPGYVTWADLRAMHAAGMAIESHTVHHDDLNTLSADSLTAELTQSRNAIAAEVGQVPAALSYPGGDYDRQVAAATKAAGYLMAVTAHPAKLVGPSNPFAWPRTGIGPRETLSNFAKVVEGTLPNSGGVRVHKGAAGPRTTPGLVVPGSTSNQGLGL